MFVSVAQKPQHLGTTDSGEYSPSCWSYCAKLNSDTVWRLDDRYGLVRSNHHGSCLGGSRERGMRVTIGIATIAIASSALMIVPAHAAQVIPKSVESTNDKIEQGGKPQACIVTVAITNPPESEVVKFQFMVFINGRFAFMVTAGDMNWSNMSLVAKRIADADFFTGAFNHPNAFDKKITTEGQLVAFLVDENLPFDFLDAFFGGNFSIRFRRTDISDERINEIGQQPGPDIAAGFKACLESMK